MIKDKVKVGKSGIGSTSLPSIEKEEKTRTLKSFIFV